MPTRTFRVFGSVSDTQTKKGIAGLRVEVWNSAAAAHLILGSGLTDAQGQFDVAAVADVPQGPVTVAGAPPGVPPVWCRRRYGFFRASNRCAISGQPDIPDLFKYKGPTALQVHPDQPQAALTDRLTVAQVFQGSIFCTSRIFEACSGARSRQFGGFAEGLADVGGQECRAEAA